MTTVVFDGVQIACDSRRTADGVIDPFNVVPKFIVEKGVLFAGCGADLWLPTFVDWWGTKGPYPMDNALSEYGGAEVAVFYRNSWRKYFYDTPHPEKLGTRWAMGTGEKFALAAMLCGRNAPEAVAVAMQLDMFSGGNIFHGELRELIAKGTEAIKEYRNVLHPAHAEAGGPPADLHARKGGANSGAVSVRRKDHKGSRARVRG